MTINSLSDWPAMTVKPTLKVYSTKTRRGEQGVVKLMTPPPPDDLTIRKLNELAAKHPFCALHKVKKHDTL